MKLSRESIFAALLSLGALAACSSGVTPGQEEHDTGDAGPDAADTSPPPDAGDQVAAPDTRPTSCSTHANCGCEGGVCLSTGECWCPPCEVDTDCPDGQQCQGGNCVTPCQGPLRLSPERGPTTGGALITVEGQGFQVGALEWLVWIGDGPWLRAFDYGGCALYFYAPPMAAGTYPVYVIYGWPNEFERPPEDTRAGMLTYETFDQTVGHGHCNGDLQCAYPETCDLGLGRCVPDLCRSLWCNPCDPIEGCPATATPCATNADCKLLYSSCSCHAVAVSDPRTQIDSCPLGGCEQCKRNRCEAEFIEAVCEYGNCTERRGDPQGVSCSRLAYTLLPGKVASDGRINQPSGATLGDRAAVVWYQSPAMRYGAIRLAAIDADGILVGPLATVDPATRSHSPTVAAASGDFHVVWVSERSQPSLWFRSYDATGAAREAEHELVEPPEGYYVPLSARLASGLDGLRLFWTQGGEGLYHAGVSGAGAFVEAPQNLVWLQPEQGSFSVARCGQRFEIGWSGDTYGVFNGVLLSDVPLTENPVRQLSPAGRLSDLASTGLGFAAAWQETAQGFDQFRYEVHFQIFDEDSRPLSQPTLVASRIGAWLHGPQVAYLGGITLVTWFEQDGYEDGAPTWIKAISLDESGRALTEPQTIFEGPVRPELLTLRFADTVLIGMVEPGETADALRFVRVSCAE